MSKGNKIKIMDDDLAEQEAVVETVAQDDPEKELSEAKERYVRLYAEFENYKKKSAKDKEELIKYGNESLVFELLSVLDNLDMALRHSNADIDVLTKGVQNTARELTRVLEKSGLSEIDACDRPFDPNVHHAMTQVERDDLDDGTIVEEFRRGYLYNDKVIRPSLVAVSKKSATKVDDDE